MANGLSEFGDDCLAHFPAGQTPKFVQVSVSGMIAGNIIPPSDPYPPNYIHYLEQHAAIPCFWTSDDGVYIVLLNTTGIRQLTIRSKATNEVVFLHNFDAGAWSYENEFLFEFGHSYYLGTAQALWMPGTQFQSLARIAGLLNIQQATDTFADFWPIDDTFHVQRFAKEDQGINISIRMEEP